jgi:4,5-dihydroxyphthalate decarboxylase
VVQWNAGRVAAADATDFELPGEAPRMPLEQDMGPMLETGEIDAIISPNAPKSLGRPDSPVRRLFQDYRNVEKDYFAKTGIFPIMHTIVLRKDVYEKHPWAAASLFEAFEQAKTWAYDQLMETDALKLTLPWVVAETEETRRIMGRFLALWRRGESSRARSVAAIFVRAAPGAAHCAD